ncbi:unnamed protein product [Arabidopsis lyrata]|uniref:Uncharacterized protein n=1 Tax=Arabidopsis lyrata subsp. lyrata TaxID=81972 RepID=D7LZV0_ARALL|nr:hypothetical protein ARALYDRAFT_908620 [Arabidopsis lyrata subsp. lyrata]CAH8270303.1 unnamed protein product [Arabidopsis lyrata]
MSKSNLPYCFLQFLLSFLADRVFVPTTTIHNVYDVAAQHVVNGAMVRGSMVTTWYNVLQCVILDMLIC